VARSYADSDKNTRTSIDNRLACPPNLTAKLPKNGHLGKLGNTQHIVLDKIFLFFIVKPGNKEFFT